MSDYYSCPNCDREAQNGISSNWFPLLRCRKCDAHFCSRCADSGDACPKCGRDDTKTSAHKLYAR